MSNPNKNYAVTKANNNAEFKVDDRATVYVSPIRSVSTGLCGGATETVVSGIRLNSPSGT